MDSSSGFAFLRMTFVILSPQGEGSIGKSLPQKYNLQP